MRRAAHSLGLAALLWLLWGCASAPPSPAALPHLEALGTPGEIWRAWLEGGSRQEAYQRFGQHLDQPSGLLGRAHTAWLGGQEEEAFARCAQLLERHPGHALARWSVACLERLREQVPQGHQRAAEVIERTGLPRIIDPAAAVLAAQLSLDAGAQRHRLSDPALPFDGLGWGQPTVWRTLGPWGDTGLLDQQRPLPPDALEHLEGEFVQPGQASLRAQTRALGQEHLRLPEGGPGTWYAEAQLDTAQRGTWLLYLELPLPTRVQLDGQEIDPGAASGARQRLLRVELGAGRHLLRLRMARGDSQEPAWRALWVPRSAGQALTSTLRPDPQRGPPAVARPQGRARLLQAQGWEMGLPLRAEPARQDPLAAWLLALWRARFEPGERGTQDSDQFAQQAPRFAGAAVIQALRAQRLRHSGDLPPYTGRRQELRAWRHALELDPSAHLAAGWLGHTLIEHGQWDTGLALLRTQATERPGSLPTWRWLAQAYRARGWWEQALDALTQARRLDSQDCELAALDQALTQRLRRPDLGAALPKACSLEPARQDSAQREASLRRALMRDPAHSHARGLLAALMTRQGQLEQASLLLERGLALDPGDVPLRLQLVDLWMAQERPEQALAALEAGLAQAPSQSSLLQMQAWLQDQLPLQDLRLEGEAWRARVAPAPGAPAQLLLDYQAAEVFADGRAWRLVHQVVQINTEAGAQRFTRVPLPSGGVLLNLTTWKPDGEPHYARRLPRQRGALPHDLRPGDLLELEYLEPLLYGLDQAPLRHSFGAVGMPTQESRFTVRAQRDDLHILTQGEPPQHQRQGQQQTWTWRRQEIPALTREPQQPRPRPDISLFLGQPLERHRQLRSEQWLRATAVTSSLRRQAMALRPEEPSREAWLRALFQWTCERVTQKDPQDWQSSAQRVMETGRGSPHVLLYALAQAAQLPVEAALLHRGGWLDAQDEAPEPELWDKVALRAWTEEGQALWMDPSLRWMPFHYLPPASQRTPGLLLGPSAAPSLQTPSFGLERERRDITQTLHIQQDGSLRGEVRVELHGYVAASLRERVQQQQSAAQKLVASIAAAEFPGHKLLRWELRQTQGRGLPLVVLFRFAQDPHARPGPQQGWLSQTQLASHHLEARLAPQAQRAQDLLLEAPLLTTVRTTCIPPRGWRVVTLPPSQRHDWAGGGFVRSTERHGARILIQDQLRLPAQRVELGAYAAFRGFARRVDEAASVTLAIEPQVEQARALPRQSQER